jgi:hypothetical protein
MQTITRDQLRTLTPSVFATTPWEGISPSYRLIPTSDVLDLLEGQGLRVTSARQSRSRIEGKAPFTRHMLRLRHDDFLHSQGEVPEVVLVNSHDRSSAYRVFSGVFRLVRENGMIIQSADFGSFSIRHSGSRDLFQQVRDATSEIMESIQTIESAAEAEIGPKGSPFQPSRQLPATAPDQRHRRTHPSRLASPRPHLPARHPLQQMRRHADRANL